MKKIIKRLAYQWHGIQRELNHLKNINEIQKAGSLDLQRTFYSSILPSTYYHNKIARSVKYNSPIKKDHFDGNLKNFENTFKEEIFGGNLIWPK